MTDNVELIKQSLNPFIINSKYKIETFDYNDGCFGNIYIILKSSFGTNIEFVRDRGIISCSIGNGTRYFDKWEDLNEVYFEMYGEYPDMPKDTEDIINYLHNIFILISNNEPMLQKLTNKFLFRKVSKRIFIRKKKEWINKYGNK